MASTIVVKEIPSGTPEYEQTRRAFLNDLANKIPEDYRLPKSIFDNPPTSMLDVPHTSGILTPEELNITENYDATALAEAIAIGKLSSVQVAKSFCKRAALAHQVTACLMDYFEHEALERAKFLDEELKRTGKPVGPLHGVPISVKEHIPLKGHWSSAGFFITREFNETDAHILQIFRDAGAVFYVKTAQPQGIMHLECDGFHGRTLNPHNIALSPGGSSGGESALLTMRGSILGIGTDIGGSIRGPAAFCGLYGFKPTANVLPFRDCIHGFPAEMNVLAAIGPMAHSLRDCDLFARVLKDTPLHVEDFRLIPFPWTGLSTPVPSPLRVGVMETNDHVMPHPPVLDAIKWAKSRISDLPNVIIKPFVSYETATAWQNVVAAYFPDAGIPFKNAIEGSGEPMHVLTRSALETVPKKALDALEMTEMRVKRDEFRTAASKAWAEQEVDIVLAPACFAAAVAHDTGEYWHYTAYWNYLDCPAIVVPTPITVGSEKREYPKDVPALNETDAHVRSLWDKHDYQGAPVNIQLIARRLHDNLLMGALGVLSEALQLK